MFFQALKAMRSTFLTIWSKFLRWGLAFLADLTLVCLGLAWIEAVWTWNSSISMTVSSANTIGIATLDASLYSFLSKRLVDFWSSFATGCFTSLLHLLNAWDTLSLTIWIKFSKWLFCFLGLAWIFFLGLIALVFFMIITSS
ncbi:unnamed protein product [Blepharisma stoltei]|uniref:Uncharacterized protein n=1 Tax=Blepharisma stoltei TaxID=1481888 RepID=A0AAU9JQX4_9CILI|nr:unnamed protein product [Blepharisma stoltei]